MKIHLIKIIVLLVAALLQSQAFAVDFSAEFGVSAEHTDNALKIADERSDLETTLFAGFFINHTGKRLSAELDYQIESIIYDQSSQDDETNVTGRSVIRFEQLPRQLFWTIENSRRSILRDQAASDIESNREDRTITRLSPDWQGRLSSVDSITLSPSYTDIRYEDSEEQDSERFGGTLRWQHRLTDLDSIEVSLTYDDIEFEDNNFDYEYYLAAFTYAASLKRLNYELSVGFNQSKRDQGDFDGQYLRFNGEYQYGASRWSLQLLNELTDTSQGNGNSGLSDLSTANNNIDVFERRNAEFTYQHQGLCAGCILWLNALIETEDFDTVTDDSREYLLGVRFDYQLTRFLSVSTEFEWSSLAFVDGNTDIDYDEYLYKMSFKRKVSKDFSVDVFVSYEDRQHDDSLLDYEDLRGGLSLNYRFN